MKVTTEDFRNFINDEKYDGVREYLLSSFKRIEKLTDLIINNPECPYNNYEEHGWLNDIIEDICEPMGSCIDLFQQ